MDYSNILTKIKIENRIPQTLIDYIVYGCNSHASNRLLERLDKRYDYTIGLLADIINRTSAITGQSPDEVVLCTDLHKHDQHFLRVSRAFGEMRIVIYLHTQNYQNIKLIKSDENITSCDIIAYIDGEKVVIEVTMSSDLEEFETSPKIFRFDSDEKILNKIESIYKSKKSQLTICQSEYKANKIMLAVILDEINHITALNYQDGFDKYTSELFNQISFRKECGLILQMQGLVSIMH